MHSQTRRVALCGVLCALAAVCLLLGSVIPAALYCCPLLAMAVLLPIREEFGPRMALTAYAAVSILAVLLAPDKELAGVYLFFGWYPAAQNALNRLRPAAARIAVKLALGNLAAVALYALLLFVFQLEAVAADFAGASAVFVLALLAMANAVFILGDLMLRRLSALWQRRLRRLWMRRSP